jgi:hypothetical protein
MRANRKVAHHAVNWLLRPTGRAEEPGLEHCPQVVAHGPMLERTSVVGEAEQVDVAHREGLLGWRGPRGYAPLMRPAHGHVGRSHVPIDEDLVELPPDLTEAASKPRACRGESFLAVAALIARLVIEEVLVDQRRDQLVLPFGDHSLEGVSNPLPQLFRTNHVASSIFGCGLILAHRLRS